MPAVLFNTPRKLWLIIVSMLALPFLISSYAYGFCGFYVAKGDASLFNKSSRVVIARHESKTVITMANDYQGEPKDFAMVIPVPYVLRKSQIHVTKPAIMDHIDSFSAPRLVEYFDDDPCQLKMMMNRASTVLKEGMQGQDQGNSAKSLGVTIEAEYSVGEYDILILSAQQSTGLLKWLQQNDYSLPDKAKPIVKRYLNQGMKFFVAKVNLKTHANQAQSFLSPLQLAFESDAFMLPIQLGRINAKEDQELFVYTITRNGKVKTTNYRTASLPTDIEIPLYIKDNFDDFYRDTFTTAHEKEKGRVVFQEYAWDMSWCDPCAADPLSVDELRELGAFWIKKMDGATSEDNNTDQIMPRTQPQEAFITRLHLRYNEETFPDDLIFEETNDKKNEQTRFILRHPWKGTSQCQAAKEYRQRLPKAFRAQAKNLAHLTNWNIDDILRSMEETGQSQKAPIPRPSEKPKPWWEEIWQNDDDKT